MKYLASLSGSYNHLGVLLAKLSNEAGAIAAYGESISIQEKLVQEHPQLFDLLIDMGGSYCNLGSLILKSNSPQDAIGKFDKAISSLNMALKKVPKHVQARLFISNAYWCRAQAFEKTSRFTDADTDWVQAIEFSPSQDRNYLQKERDSWKLKRKETTTPQVPANPKENMLPKSVEKK